MQITQDDVAKIARLARLNFSTEALQKFEKEMNDILGFFDVLNEVNTDGVLETTQVTGLMNVTRPDVVTLCPFEKQILDCSPHPLKKNCLAIPRIM